MMNKKKYKCKVKIIFLILLMQPLLFCQEKLEKHVEQIEVTVLTGPLIQSEAAQKISAEQVKVLDTVLFEKDETLFQQINQSFDVDINRIKVVGNATLVVPVQSLKENVTWAIGEFLIKLSFDQTPQSVPSGKILMQNTRKKVNYISDFQVKDGSTLFAFIRNQENLILLAMQKKIARNIPELQDTPQDNYTPVKDDTGYCTEYRTGTCVIFSKDMSWDGDVLGADEVLFDHAKAVIPTENGDIILKGEKILYSKQDKVIIGFKAVLLTADGKTHGNNSRITVPLENATQFKIDQ